MADERRLDRGPLPKVRLVAPGLAPTRPEALVHLLGEHLEGHYPMVVKPLSDNPTGLVEMYTHVYRPGYWRVSCYWRVKSSWEYGWWFKVDPQTNYGLWDTWKEGWRGETRWL